MRLNQFIVAWVGVLVISFVSRGADVDPASPIADAIHKADAAIAKIVALPAAQRTFDNTVGAIDDVIVQFEIDTSMTQFMTHVSTDPAERERGALAEEHYSNWHIELGKNEPLYRAVRTVADRGVKLEGERKRLLEHTLRDYRRAGMELTPEQRDELTKVQKEIARLQIEFEKNIRNDETTVPLTKAELAGMEPEFFADVPMSEGLYLVGMSAPVFTAVMDFCENETTRQRVWTAYKRRGGRANVAIIEKVLGLRAQEAKLLGYAHPADYAIEVRMAKNAAAVQAFYAKLRPLVRPKAQSDYDEYLAAKRAYTNSQSAKLYPWDQNFIEKHLKREKYAVDAKKVQQYFPLERVMDGLFAITQSLYGLEYKEITRQAKSKGRPLWHEDVRLFEVWDKASNAHLGDFYIDLFPRDNKYTHAAQWGLIPRKKWPDGRIEKPLAALVCNFTKPTDDAPSLLTHDEVETFFHEFGHCLHTILTEAEYGRFAGTATEDDFVEAPSQMFENWVWEPDVLRLFAKHHQTGEVLPAELIEGMRKARYLGSGLFAEHQFFYGLCDFNFNLDPDGDVNTTELQDQLFAEIELYDPVPHTHFHASFGHLVNPGYVAGYYGYQWSLVYAQDMFQRFKELGMLDPEAGMYYRQKILARGGTIDGLDMVKDYLGREPSMDAYLEHLGLKP